MARAESAEARELADLRRRIGALERMLGPRGETICGAVGEAIGKARVEARKEIATLREELDPTIKDVVAKELTRRAVMVDQGV